MSEPKTQHLTPGALAEIPLYQQDSAEMKRSIADLKGGKMTEDDFRKYRLQRGIYGQRQKPDIQMIRVKLPWGLVTAAQLNTLADVADTYSGADRKGRAHVTTRQAVQFHFVSLAQVPDAMMKLSESGLTSREACANTVRNVTCDPLAGVAQDEIFDVQPYAEAIARYFLRNPVTQDLPRKFKIAVSSSAADRGLIPMHCVGVLPDLQEIEGKAVRGFKLFVGGGLGPTPKSAQLLEEFTPAEDLLRTIHAIAFVFNRDWDYGRKFRNMARLKFLVEKIGIEEFAKRVFEVRKDLDPAAFPKIDAPAQLHASVPVIGFDGPWESEPDDENYWRWKETNVEEQKQHGYHVVTLRLPLGDISSVQLRALAKIVAKYSDGTARSTVTQNFNIRWIKTEALPSIYKELSAVGLTLGGAHRLVDVTSCPGADTCQLGITSSRGLATAIGKIFSNGYAQDADLKDFRIKISGCPNSCGQHHIADIGFFGGSKMHGERQIPTYSMLLGGFIGEDGHAYGKMFLRVPAKQIPFVVGKMLDLYRAQKKEGEKFRQFVTRVGFDALKKEVGALVEIPETPPKDFFEDWGESGAFHVSTGPGECAA